MCLPESNTLLEKNMVQAQSQEPRGSAERSQHQKHKKSEVFFFLYAAAAPPRRRRTYYTYLLGYLLLRG